MPIAKGTQVTPDVLIDEINATQEAMSKAMAGYDERLAKSDGSLSEIKALVTDVQKEFADRARHELGGKLTNKLFGEHDIEGALTWDAVHKAPTAVKLKGSIRNLEPLSADRDDLVGRFQEKSDQLYILAAALKLVDEDGMLKTERVRKLKFYQREYMPVREKLAGALEKDGFNVGGAGAGLEWDPASFSTRVWELARLPWKLEGLIPSFALPRSPFVFPVVLADLVAYLVAEISTAPPILGTTAGYIPDGKGTTTISGKKTFTAVKLASMAFASKESEEDLIVPILPRLQQLLVYALNNAKEKAFLRGFKTRGGVSGSYDSDTTGATDSGKAFDGLFDYALNVTANTVKDAGGVNINTDALWREQMRGARKLMDDPYKGDAGNLVMVVSGTTAIDVGSCESYRTAYAMGGMSTNRMGDSTGFQPDGLQAFIVSQFIRTDLGSGGFHAGLGNDNFTAAIQFYPQAWLVGEERQLRIEVARERFFEYDVDAVKITYRADLQAMLAGKHTVITSDLLAA